MILLLIQLAWCLLAPQPRQVAAGLPTAIYGFVSDLASGRQTEPMSSCATAPVWTA